MDALLVMVPIQLVALGVLQVSALQANIAFFMLYALYNILFILHMQGQTPGKAIGRLVVVDKDEGTLELMRLGMREMLKCLYFVPFAGWAFALVSVVVLAKTGEALHDKVGGTRVVSRSAFLRQKERDEDG